MQTPQVFASVWQRAKTILRAKRIRQSSWRYFDSAVYNCARVSANNKRLAFAIHHVGPFGGPSVKLIPRPDIVKIEDTMNCVIVRDGVVYEMIKAIR